MTSWTSCIRKLRENRDYLILKFNALRAFIVKKYYLQKTFVLIEIKSEKDF